MFQFLLRFLLYISVNNKLCHVLRWKFFYFTWFIQTLNTGKCKVVLVSMARSDVSIIKPPLKVNLILVIYGM